MGSYFVSNVETDMSHLVPFQAEESMGGKCGTDFLLAERMPKGTKNEACYFPADKEYSCGFRAIRPLPQFRAILNWGRGLILPFQVNLGLLLPGTQMAT